jgi:hypothetical protein
MNDTDRLAESLRVHLEDLRSHLEDTGETPETTELHLTREEFMIRMLLEPNGQAMLDLMEDGEWKVCERMGLTNAYYKEGVAYIDVPRWKNLVAHLKICNQVFSQEEE